MAATFVYRVSGDNGNGSGAVAITLDAATLVGDVILAVLAIDVTGGTSDTVSGVPSGWTIYRAPALTGNVRAAAYWWRVNTAGPSTHTWTFDGSHVAHIGAVCYRGALAQGSPIVSGGFTGGTAGGTTEGIVLWTPAFTGLAHAMFCARADDPCTFSGNRTMRTLSNDWSGNDAGNRMCGVMIEDTPITAGSQTPTMTVTLSGTGDIRWMSGMVIDDTTSPTHSVTVTQTASLAGGGPSPSGIAVRSAGSTNNGGGSSTALTVQLDSSTQVGDVVLCLVTLGGSNTLAPRLVTKPNAGWTNLYTLQSGFIVHYIYWYRAPVFGIQGGDFTINAPAAPSRLDWVVYSGVTLSEVPILQGDIALGSGVPNSGTAAATFPRTGWGIQLASIRSNDLRSFSNPQWILRTSTTAFSGDVANQNCVGGIIADSGSMIPAGTLIPDKIVTISGLSDVVTVVGLLLPSNIGVKFLNQSASVQHAAAGSPQVTQTASISVRQVSLRQSAALDRGGHTLALSQSASIVRTGFAQVATTEYVRTSGRYVVTAEAVPILPTISFVAGASANNGTGDSNITLSLPGTVQIGDLVLVVIAAEVFDPGRQSVSFVNPPAGFTKVIGSAHSSLHYDGLFWGRLLVNGAQTLTFGIAASTPASIAAGVYRGAHPTAVPITGASQIYGTDPDREFISPYDTPSPTVSLFRTAPAQAWLFTMASTKNDVPLNWDDIPGWKTRASDFPTGGTVGTFLSDTAGPINRGTFTPIGEELLTGRGRVSPYALPQALIVYAGSIIPGTASAALARTVDQSASLSTTAANTISRQVSQDASLQAFGLSGVTATSINQTTATIIWTSDPATDTQVDYGLTTAYGTTTPLDPALSTAHLVTLTGLTASTTYHYRVTSHDVLGNALVSNDQQFTTLAVFDSVPPRISDVQSISLSPTSEQISWTTEEPADSQVEYGTTTAYGTLSQRQLGLVTVHSITISGLQPDTTYHFRVISRDVAGNMATS